MNNKSKGVVLLTQSAMIAAIYVILTVLISAFNLASGAIQVRISEALTILPAFTNAAVPGLFVGCLLSNIITGCLPMDVVFGSIATLIGAIGTYALKDKNRFLASVPPIVSNTVIVPLLLRYVYNIPGSIPYFMLTVGIGEVISCGIIGQILYQAIYPIKSRLFNAMPDSPNPEDKSLSDEEDSNTI